MPEQFCADAPNPSDHASPENPDGDEIDRSGNPQDGPYQQRRKLGKAEPERAANGDPRADETPDQFGIEVDSARERPHDGEHGRRSN